MKETNVTASVDKCIHCHICQKNCDFLSKYGIDIGDTDKLYELAYHCFLCGKCTEVCPVDIDGRAEVMKLRRERVASGDTEQLKKSKGLIAEKSEYKFRNYKHATENSVFFPGCNFPSMYPKTTAEISRIMRKHGIGTVYDCCGKPISELGMMEGETRIIDSLNKRFVDNNISEIITACPNCRGFLTGKINVKITGIYEKLRELGYGTDIEGDVKLYVPCPDRQDHIWIDEISAYVRGEVELISSPQCCGLGGSASVNESEIAKGFSVVLRNEIESSPTKGNTCMYLYCASCAGNFKRNGINNTKHILPEILGTGEKPDTIKSYINRMRTRVI